MGVRNRSETDINMDPAFEIKGDSVKNTQCVLMKRPVGDIKDDDLQVREVTLNCTLENGEVLVRVELVSLDPTHRVWMNDMDSYLPPVKLGAVMRAGGAGYVVKSKDPKTPVGSYVGGLVGIQEYCIAKPNDAKDIFSSVKVLPGSESMPHSNFMSLLAPHIGGTAYTGTVDICGKNVGPGKTFVVSGASGAVGSLAGQLGKIRGARVIGIVGSAEKVRRCLEDYKFDGAINYKTDDIMAKLKELAPNGVDAYFDNVGGKVSDAVWMNINKYGKIAQCGMISTYNSKDGAHEGPKAFGRIISHRITVQGFIAGDTGPDDKWEKFETIAPKLIKWRMEGHMKFHEDIQKGGPANYVNSLRRLFTGANTGKLILRMF